MSPPDRATAFLRAAGWGGAARAPLAGDASNRRYERLSGGPGGRGAVLMDAPAARGEDIRPFLAMTGWLRGRGLSAPAIYEADAEAGLALIEDLGDALYIAVCRERPELETPLYETAIDLLAALHSAPPPAAVEGCGARTALALYGRAALVREAALAVEWWAPAAAAETPDGIRAAFDALIAACCARPAADRSAMVLRDYHAGNLVWLPERRGAARVGLLDYQDALAGAPAYDLVSLLEDARRDVDGSLRAAMTARYAAATGADADALAADAAALGAQRNLKIVGVFARLWLRDAKPGYLDMIPRVWAHLTRDLAHPALADLAAFVERRIPAPTPEALARVRAARR